MSSTYVSNFNAAALRRTSGYAYVCTRNVRVKRVADLKEVAMGILAKAMCEHLAHCAAVGYNAPDRARCPFLPPTANRRVDHRSLPAGPRGAQTSCVRT